MWLLSIVEITISCHSFVLSQSCFEVPASLSDVGGLAVGAVDLVNYGGPKGSNTKQFTKSQINFSKHKSVYQNTKQFTKTQNNLPNHKSISQKHKSVYQNTKQILKTQIIFLKHKSVYQNTNQFLKTQTNFPNHKSKHWALAP